MKILETHALAIGYPHSRQTTTVIADHLDLELQAGELVCLLGPNGAGKSTLMRTLAGMQAPLSGQVTLMGDNILTLKAAELARRLSIVLTTRVQAGLLNGYALIALGRHPYTDWLGRLSRRDEAVIRWAVQAVGAEELAPRQIMELSDGERQRIMIARALAQETPLMILDEPTAYLDLPHRVEIMRLLRQLAQETNRAILLSTHDLDLALRTAHKIWLLPKGGQLQVGSPEDLILSGAFEQTFQSQGVSFDPQSGSFKIERDSVGYVRVVGSGITELWTKRALEREGYTIATNGHIPLATIEILGEQRWHLQTLQTSTQHDSIADLLTTVKGLNHHDH